MLQGWRRRVWCVYVGGVVACGVVGWWVALVQPPSQSRVGGDLSYLVPAALPVASLCLRSPSHLACCYHGECQTSILAFHGPRFPAVDAWRRPYFTPTSVPLAAESLWV